MDRASHAAVQPGPTRPSHDVDASRLPAGRGDCRAGGGHLAAPRRDVNEKRGTARAGRTASTADPPSDAVIHQLTDLDPYACRVSVYRNLRTGGWSIKTAETHGDIPKGKVIAHADECAITDAVFEVNASMLAATVAGTGKRGHKRNVFAWITGKLADGQVVVSGQRVTFHPFERPDFYVVETGRRSPRRRGRVPHQRQDATTRS